MLDDAESCRSRVIMQGFYRDATAPGKAWWDHLADQAHALRSVGFTAIWIPPVLKGDSGGFSAGYDPFDDYDIGSKDQQDTFNTHWGSREELQRMVAIMRANGLDVYVDMVLNHRNGDDGDKKFRYKDAFGNVGAGRLARLMSTSTATTGETKTPTFRMRIVPLVAI